MKGHLIHLFEYSRWASDLVVRSIEQSEPEDERCAGLFSHIAAAEAIWLARVRGESTDMPVWPERPLEESRHALVASTSGWFQFFAEAGENDLKTPFAYKTTNGVPYQNSVKEIATHVVNHGTHHRAQISARLRELGHEAPASDYIFYLRENPKT